MLHYFSKSRIYQNNTKFTKNLPKFAQNSPTFIKIYQKFVKIRIKFTKIRIKLLKFKQTSPKICAKLPKFTWNLCEIYQNLPKSWAIKQHLNGQFLYNVGDMLPITPLRCHFANVEFSIFLKFNKKKPQFTRIVLVNCGAMTTLRPVKVKFICKI